MIGTTVGGYSITSKVSVGGMGTVYRAEHTLIGKAAAIKVLHPQLRSNQEVVNRFFNEAKATTQIKHPGIVEIFDFGYLPSGDGYIVMEFLEGASLATRLADSPRLDEGEAAALMRGVCSALAAAHAKGIIHRDLKPDNIFVCPDPDAPTGERAKLLDFGIAKLTDTTTGEAANATKTGMLMGTPTYMSPEQCKGAGTVDLRTDLYSIGCIFYEMLCGEAPFDNMAPGELIASHLFVEPVAPAKKNPAISAEAEQLILALLAKDPAKRPQSAGEVSRRFAALAQAQGLAVTTNPVGFPRVSRAENIPPSAASETGPVAMPSAHPQAPAAPAVAPMPTTLSSVASESLIEVPRSRVRLWAGLAAAAVAAAIVLVMITRGGDEPRPANDGSTDTPATAPTVATPPAPPSQVEPPAAAVPQPTPAESPPAVATPAESPPPAVDSPAIATPQPARWATPSTGRKSKHKSGSTKAGKSSPEAKTTTASTPATTKPAATTTATKPTATTTATKPTATTTATKPTTTTTTTKPTTTTPKPTATTQPTKPNLIETDL